MENNLKKVLEHTMKYYTKIFLTGILIGCICRLADYFPAETLWSFSSIQTLFGFWIASVGLITYFSSSNKRAFLNTFLYMFGMTISFYGLKFILGFRMQKFANDGQFQTGLFLLYSVLSVVCGVGSFVLYEWNKGNRVSSILYALPASGMLAEAAGCMFVLINSHMLLAQTLFDFIFAMLFGVTLFKKAVYKKLYLISLIIVATLVFLLVYKPFLTTV